MNEELKYQVSCLLLKMERGILSGSDVKERVDKWIEGLKDSSELIDVSLASTDNDIIEGLYSCLNHKIHPSAYHVVMSDLLIKNQATDSLKKLDILIDYLRSKQNTEVETELYHLTPFLESLFGFIYWCWDELHVTREGTLGGLNHLEKNLNKLFDYLIKFKVDNLNGWEKVQNEVLELMNYIRTERKKQR